MAAELTSGLARKLFGGAAGIEQKLALRTSPPESFWEFCGLGQLPGWPALEQLLNQVIEQKIPTLVYGDYDVDGVTSAFMMHRFLKRHRVPGNCFLPSRFRHGYGLNPDIISQAVRQGYGALLALDCGTADAAAVDIALHAGIEVGIIDHHQPGQKLPRAPMLNPSLADDVPQPCTAGLVYAVLEQVAAKHGGLAGDELELAGMATIADVVPLTPANWYLAGEALRLLPSTTNCGLQALIRVSGLHGLTRLTAQQVAFAMVPRLNACLLYTSDAADE